MSITKKHRLIITGTLVVSSLILRVTIGMDQIYTKVIMIISTAIAGWPIFKKAISALRYGILGIDALVSIATIGATIIGEYWEAAAVTFLFMLGDYLESRTIEKTRSSIKKLLDLRPLKAKVIRNEVEMEILPEEVLIGDQVIVRPGEKIAVDGVVVKGEAYVNEAAITGESIPMNKVLDSNVFSGTVIESGFLIIEALRVGDDTTFARILEMVEEAQDKKAKTQKFIEKFSKYYTPSIIILSIIFYLIRKDIYLSLTLLVISCPGALVISTPVSIVAGIGNGARRGIIFKGGETTEAIRRVKVLAFDKTGTLTIGRPVVTNVKGFGEDAKEVLHLAAIGETYSEHPLGKAIIAAAKKENVFKDLPEEVEIISGKGISFVYQNDSYLIGNRSFFSSVPKDIEAYLQEEERQAQTAVILGRNDKIIGVISISDQIREGVIETISRLRKLGIRKMLMLTGDNELTAKAISEKIGLDGYYAKLLPEEKVQIVRELHDNYGFVGMVGDGVNDAPALATADLGIAVGGAGKDIAMETADVILLSEDISRLSYAINLGKATVRNMFQNIVFAILVTLFLLVGVLLDSVHLAMGMLVHELSVLLVIINAMRLLGFKEKGNLDN